MQYTYSYYVIYYFAISCCGCDVNLRRCLILLCIAMIMYCNYVLYARNNCWKPHTVIIIIIIIIVFNIAKTQRSTNICHAGQPHTV